MRVTEHEKLVMRATALATQLCDAAPPIQGSPHRAAVAERLRRNAVLFAAKLHLAPALPQLPPPLTAEELQAFVDKDSAKWWLAIGRWSYASVTSLRDALKEQVA